MVNREIKVLRKALRGHVKAGFGHWALDMPYSDVAPSTEGLCPQTRHCPFLAVQVCPHVGELLSGEVNWSSDREAAEHTVRKLSGVVGVTNLITTKTYAIPNLKFA